MAEGFSSQEEGFSSQEETAAPVAPVEAKEPEGFSAQEEPLTVGKALMDIPRTISTLGTGIAAAPILPVVGAVSDPARQKLLQWIQSMQPQTALGKAVVGGASLPATAVSEGVKKLLTAMGRSPEVAEREAEGVLGGLALGGVVKGATAPKAFKPQAGEAPTPAAVEQFRAAEEPAQMRLPLDQPPDWSGPKAATPAQLALPLDKMTDPNTEQRDISLDLNKRDAAWSDTPAGAEYRLNEATSDAGKINERADVSSVLTDAAEAAKTAASAPEEVVRSRFDKLHDLVTTNPIPALSRHGESVINKAFEHAYAKGATPTIVKSMISDIFGADYKNPEVMSKFTDILVKDNVLGLYDRALDKANKAIMKGDNDTAAQWTATAQRIQPKVNQYAADVQAAMKDPTFVQTLGRYAKARQRLDAEYEIVKGVNPMTYREGRGRYLGTRINLVPKGMEKRINAFTKDERIAPPQSFNDELNVKPDMFDKQAKGFDEYSTDMSTILTAVLGRRHNEATKVSFYKELLKSGAAKDITGVPMTPELQKQFKGGTLDFKFPYTDRSTGMTDYRVRRIAFTDDAVAREAAQVIDANASRPGSAVGDYITAYQLMSPVDFIVHMKNLQTKMLRNMAIEPGMISKGVNMFPYLRTAQAIYKTIPTLMDIMADSAYARQKESFLAENGMLRPQFRPTSMSPLNTTQRIIHSVDSAVRIYSNNVFDQLVRDGIAKDTMNNRRQFVNEIGQYNPRLWPALMKQMPRWFHPFVVAGTSFNKLGVKTLIGRPGFESTSFASATKAWASMAMYMAAIIAIPRIMNYFTTANLPGGPYLNGRPGTPMFGVDHGGPIDETGKFQTSDFGQTTGTTRGSKLVGLEAAYQGVRKGEDVGQMTSQALTQAARGLTNPFLGPAPRMASEALTGTQLGMREYHRQVIAEGGIRQKIEDFRAALEDTNPPIFELTRPLWEAWGFTGAPQKKEDRDRGFGARLIDAWLATPLEKATGEGTSTVPLTGIGEQAKEVAGKRYAQTTPTQEQFDIGQARKALTTKLLEAKTPEEKASVAREMATALQSGQITPAGARGIAKAKPSTEQGFQSYQKYLPVMTVPELFKLYDDPKAKDADKKLIAQQILVNWRRDSSSMTIPQMRKYASRLKEIGASIGAK